MSKLPAVLYGPSYKATSYALFAGMLLILSLMIFTAVTLIDYAVKSDKPILDFFRATESELAAENLELKTQVDSLARVAKQVPALKKLIQDKPTRGRVSNVKVPQFEPYSVVAPEYGTPAHTKYLVNKIQVITAQRDSLIRFVENNFVNM